jgi:hypothetical protein
MANLVSSSTRLVFTGKLWDHFETFAREITINKSPIQVINQINTSPVYGYGEESTPLTEITYTPVSNSSYSGMILYNYNASQNSDQMDTKLRLNPNSIYLKTTEEAKNYIKNGTKTESIIADGNTFNLAGNEAVQNYLGLKFYYFELKQTN